MRRPSLATTVAEHLAELDSPQNQALCVLGKALEIRRDRQAVAYGVLFGIEAGNVS
jgi:hypothetical protein